MSTAADPPATPPADDGLWAGVTVVDAASLAGVSRLSGPALGMAMTQTAGLMTDPKTLSPAQLVELATGAERLIRWCQAVQLGAVDELANYASPDLPEDGPVAPTHLDRVGATERTVERGFATPLQVGEFLSDGLSCALSISLSEADRLVGAAGCVRDCQSVRELLCRGDIGLAKVKVLDEELAPLRHDPDLTAIAAKLAQSHAALTTRKFRHKVKKAVIERIGTTEDHLNERARRKVWFRPEGSGMATLGAYLPAEDARLAFETLTAAAMQNHADTEAADGPCQDRTDGETGYCSQHGGALSLDNLRADAFTGWVLAEHAGLIDPTTGEFDDHTGDAVRHWRRPKRHDVSRVMLHLHMNASTLAGVDDLPGHLMGYGTIDADHTRRLCENATVIRILTDPVTRQVTAMDTSSYKVPKILKWSVQSRDGYCVFPTCERVAHTGQIDHREPHPGGRAAHPGGRAGAKLEALGVTSYDNLQSLCTRHHRLKTHGGWTVFDTGDGRLEWQGPQWPPVRPRRRVHSHPDPERGRPGSPETQAPQTGPTHHRTPSADPDPAAKNRRRNGRPRRPTTVLNWGELGPEPAADLPHARAQHRQLKSYPEPRSAPARQGSPSGQTAARAKKYASAGAAPSSR